MYVDPPTFTSIHPNRWCAKSLEYWMPRAAEVTNDGLNVNFLLSCSMDKGRKLHPTDLTTFVSRIARRDMLNRSLSRFRPFDACKRWSSIIGQPMICLEALLTRAPQIVTSNMKKELKDTYIIQFTADAGICGNLKGHRTCQLRHPLEAFQLWMSSETCTVDSSGLFVHIRNFRLINTSWSTRPGKRAVHLNREWFSLSPA